ncbi:4671_t:CDS:2, partial [Acaulospora colombiana]
ELQNVQLQTMLEVDCRLPLASAPASIMRSALQRLAQPILLSDANTALYAAKDTLLPPVPLYRNLLRIHRRLPIEMRSLGDDYVKSEFKRHKTADNPVHIMGFLVEWNRYLDQLDVQLGAPGTFRGRKMDDTMFEKLYELMHASKDVWKPVEKDAKKD